MQSDSNAVADPKASVKEISSDSDPDSSLKSPLFPLTLDQLAASSLRKQKRAPLSEKMTVYKAKECRVESKINPETFSPRISSCIHF